jgi:hypothetical protein
MVVHQFCSPKTVGLDCSIIKRKIPQDVKTTLHLAQAVMDERVFVAMVVTSLLSAPAIKRLAPKAA